MLTLIEKEIDFGDVIDIARRHDMGYIIEPYLKSGDGEVFEAVLENFLDDRLPTEDDIVYALPFIDDLTDMSHEKLQNIKKCIRVLHLPTPLKMQRTFCLTPSDKNRILSKVLNL